MPRGSTNPPIPGTTRRTRRTTPTPWRASRAGCFRPIPTCSGMKRTASSSTADIATIPRAASWSTSSCSAAADATSRTRPRWAPATTTCPLSGSSGAGSPPRWSTSRWRTPRGTGCTWAAGWFRLDGWRLGTTPALGSRRRRGTAASSTSCSCTCPDTPRARTRREFAPRGSGRTAEGRRTSRCIARTRCSSTPPSSPSRFRTRHRLFPTSRPAG